MILLLATALGCSSSAPPPAPSAPTAESAAPAEERVLESVRVTASMLNVRSEPTANGEVIAQVRRGTRLEMTAEDSGWLKVRLSDGRVGWISGQHVSRGSAATPSRVRGRGGCPPDSDYSFLQPPRPGFSDRGPRGMVVVEASVDARGNVVATRVISNSTGEEAAGSIAENEIRAARFAAPIRNCQPRPFVFTYKRTF